MYICGKMSKLKVNIDQEEPKELESLADGSFSINGDIHEFDFQPLGENKYHILNQNRSYNAEVLEFDAAAKRLAIRVNNHLYQIEVEDRYDLLLQKLGMEDLAAAGVTELKAPMPGLVLSIEVEVGQELKQDEPLIVLEAMKMENVLKAPADVVVKSIGVEQGQAVEKNQLLIEFES